MPACRMSPGRLRPQAAAAPLLMLTGRLALAVMLPEYVIVAVLLLTLKVAPDAPLNAPVPSASVPPNPVNETAFVPPVELTEVKPA